MKITVIGGQGVVGRATAEIFKGEGNDVDIIDMKSPKSLRAYDIIEDSKIVFISVPTPWDPSKGDYDYSCIEGVFKHLHAHGYNHDGLVCLRSTVAPSFFGNNRIQHFHRQLIYHPEFLSQRTAETDIKTQSIRIYGVPQIFGADPGKFAEEIEPLYPNHDHAAILVGSWKEIALLKLMHNAWGAMNITFSNEMKFLCDKLEINWADLGDDLGILLKRLGRDFQTYNKVPGHDGKCGFSGKCFPKDLRVLHSMCKGNDTYSNLLEGIIKTNTLVRPEE